MKQAKQLHLDNEVIEVLAIQAIKEKTTFKLYAQKVLGEKAVEIAKANAIS